MRHLPLALALAPLSLFAQTPAPAPTPAPQAAPAPAAPSLADQYKAQAPAIQALLKADPDAALAKVEALIPAQAPVFDKSGIVGAQKSMGEYDALVKIYALAANSANDAGQWEKAKDYATKTQVTAQATYDNAKDPLTTFRDTWKKAQDDAQKNLDEMGTLAKVDKPTPEQTTRLAFLQKNQQVFTGNAAQGKQMVDAVDSNLNGLKAAPGDYSAYIASIDARLKSEQDNLDKFKGDKKKYVEAYMRSLDELKDPDQKLLYLRRLHVVDPQSKAVTHKIDVLMGRAKDEPVKKAVHHKKSN